MLSQTVADTQLLAPVVTRRQEKLPTPIAEVEEAISDIKSFEGHREFESHKGQVENVSDFYVH